MKGKIYRIYWPDGRFYIGSTIKKLNDRFNDHKSINHLNLLPKDWSEAKIECLEEVECETRRDLNYLERIYLETCTDDLCLNTYKPYRTDEERKEYERIKDMTWKKMNRERVNELARALYYRRKNTGS
jgi:Uri superfamily endonuclease